MQIKAFCRTAYKPRTHEAPHPRALSSKKMQPLSGYFRSPQIVDLRNAAWTSEGESETAPRRFAALTPRPAESPPGQADAEGED